MTRENSFSDEGRSLTPDLEEAVAPQENLAASDMTATEPAPALTQVASAPGPTTEAQQEPVRPTLQLPGGSAPGDRFRSSVRKVMQLHRTSTVISTRGVGAEPGVDPRRASAAQQYGHIHAHCVIEIIDYSSVRSSVGKMTNSQFVQLMQDRKASEKEDWAKVRWISIGGISWDVISALAIRYDLHPLAVEDVLHQPRHARSKADYYHKHLFMRILCHSLGLPPEAGVHEHDSANFPTSPTSAYDGGFPSMSIPRSSSPSQMREDGYISDEEKMTTSSSRFSTAKKSSSFGRGTVKRLPKLNIEAAHTIREKEPVSARFPMAKSKAADHAAHRMKTIELLKRDQRINVQIAPMCIFLARDGTVISIHPAPDLTFTSPISARLRQRDGLLRTSADASLLVQSLLDLIVDRALEVTDEYQAKIVELEHEVLMKPKMDTVKYLHIIQGDLILHKRTLDPIKTVVYGLRRYDQDRCAALLADHGEDVDPKKVQGYMSHKSKIYLADVVDHMDYILTSLDMFAGISENLINYTFNMSSNQMNEVMRRLTLATIVFLPLTLLTGYFGMNFDSMWTVKHGHTDVIFWIIALPVMAIVVPLFMWTDFKHWGAYLHRRLLDKRVAKSIKIE